MRQVMMLFAGLVTAVASSMAARPSHVVLPTLPEGHAAMASRSLDTPDRPLQVGVARDIPDHLQVASGALEWEEAPDGAVARWTITSQGARALRLGLEDLGPARDLQVRFIDQALGISHGPYVGGWESGRTFWSPVLEGESAIVELFVPTGAERPATLRVSRLSHLFASLSEPETALRAKAGGACQVDLACRSATDPAIEQLGKSVARLSYVKDGATYSCTATLLATKPATGRPYLYTSFGCIDSQAAADTLTTHWFYERDTCGGGALSAQYTQVAGGAVLLYGNPGNDIAFLRMNGPAPAGAVFADWYAGELFTTGKPVLGIHHPDGDFKKVSAGQFSGYFTVDGRQMARVTWDSVATGVMEPGSRGSPAFVLDPYQPGTGYKFVGALSGGLSSCSAPSSDLLDFYSRLDLAYYAYSTNPQLSAWLDPIDVKVGLAGEATAPSIQGRGRDVQYVVKVQNTGPAAATGVKVTYTVKAPTIFSTVPCTPNATNEGGTCELGSLANGASREFRLVVRVPLTQSGLSFRWSMHADQVNRGGSPSAVFTTAAGYIVSVQAIPRYRLYSPVTLEHHFTTSLHEYNTLGAQVGTWIQEGQVGKVFNIPTVFNGVETVPYYRLYDPSTRWHHWTTDPNEYYTLSILAGWTGEEIDGFILPASAPGTIELYRLNYPFIPGLHHWTIDPDEYNALITEFGWVGEGGSGWVIP